MINRLNGAGLPQTKGFGLVAWLEETRLVLPLRAVDCRFDVQGDLLSVEIAQIFYQNNTQPLDCLYTFPLPAGAAVHRCEMHVNSRIIRARVEEENRARELAAEHKAAGHRTALVEMDRENLFTLSLGNLQPGDTVIVRLAYFQTLTRLEDWSSFHIPFCPGVKYIPGKPLLRSASGKGTADDTDQVPDASRISPPRMGSDSDDAASLSIQGTVHDTGGRIRDLSSPSHPVIVRDGSQIFSVNLAEGSSVPDQDFVMRWTEALPEELGVAAWSWTDREDTYAMIRIMPPMALTESDAPRKEQTTKDVYFLLDHSGSMTGLNWEKTAQAFLGFLQAMNAADRVWLTLFTSSHQDFAEKPLPASVLLRDPRAINLPALAPNGGTEVLPALEHVVTKIRQHSMNQNAILVMITDGQIGNEDEVLNLLQQSPDLTLHVLGIDAAPNDAFLKALSDQHGGSWHQMHPNDDIEGTVKRLAGRLRPAVLESLEVAHGWEPARTLPSKAHMGQSTVLLLKRSGPDTGNPLQVAGRTASGTPWSVSFTDTGMAPGNEAVEKLWQKQRIEASIREGKTDEAITLAKTANLICKGTAFIAWDESQQVPISKKEVFQPTLSNPNQNGLLEGLISETQAFYCKMPTRSFTLSIQSEFEAFTQQLATPSSLEILIRLRADWNPNWQISTRLWEQLQEWLLLHFKTLPPSRSFKLHKKLMRVVAESPNEDTINEDKLRRILELFSRSLASQQNCQQTSVPSQQLGMSSTSSDPERVMNEGEFNGAMATIKAVLCTLQPTLKRH